MVEEVISIISDIDTHISQDPGFSDANRQKVAMYMDIVKETMQNQHELIDSYETITKKLEEQITECQAAIDESTTRETEQLEMIMQLKEQYDKLKEEEDDDDTDEDDCPICDKFEEQNQALRDNVEVQEQVIEKLSKAQELLMLQYKVMEMGLNKELLSIQKTQDEIKAMQGDIA